MTPTRGPDTLASARRLAAVLATLVLAFGFAACGRAGTVGSASGGHHLVIAPERRFSPVVCSEGTSPR